MRIHPVFHISLLKRYKTSPPEFPRDNRTPPPPVTIAGQDEPEYEVEAILDKRTHRGSPQYLVHWKGYPVHDATWEPIANLRNARRLVREYDNSR